MRRSTAVGVSGSGGGRGASSWYTARSSGTGGGAGEPDDPDLTLTLCATTRSLDYTHRGLEDALRHLNAAARELATATGDVFADVRMLEKWLFDDTARVYAARAAMRISAARKCPLVSAAVPPNAVTVLESGGLKPGQIVACAKLVHDAIAVVAPLCHVNHAATPASTSDLNAPWFA